MVYAFSQKNTYLSSVLMVLVTAGVSASTARAQVSIPRIAVAAQGVSTLSLSASEAAYHVQVRSTELHAAILTQQKTYPIDSINAIVKTTGDTWLAKLQANPVRGIQLDAAGGISVVANQEEQAKRLFAERLATPGLSRNDRAFTYSTAVKAFTDLYHPERLPTAEAYLRELDALGDSAATWQFDARKDIVGVYYMLGRGADVVRHGTRAIELVRVMSFPDRRKMYPWGGGFYMSTAQVLAGQPGGRAKIAHLDSLLLAGTVPSKAALAFNPDFEYIGQDYRRVLGDIMKASGLLGTVSGPMISNYWLNRTSSDSQAVSVTDGKIRVIEIGSYYCAPCLEALQGMQRIHEALPEIEVMMMTGTNGFWANRLIEADEEVEKLKDYYLNIAKVTIPVGIWKAKKVQNENGDIYPEGGPTFERYPILGKPTIWIVDGRGVIRQVYGSYSRELESQIINTVMYLEREAGTRPPAASPTLPPILAQAKPVAAQ